MGRHGSGSKVSRSRLFKVAFIFASALAAFGATAVAAGSRTSTPGGGGPAVAGELYFTTFQPPAVLRVSYAYRQGQFRLGQPNTIARLVGADGVVFGPDGRLLIGGTARDHGRFELVNQSGQSVEQVATGIPASFMIALAPGNRSLYTAGLPGELATVPLDPPGAGRAIPLSGADVSITGVAFAPNGKVLYTSSPAGGQGDIGLIDLANGRTTRIFRNVTGAHGIFYDAFSNCFIVVGGETIYQLSADDPRQVVSELKVPGTRLDQGAVDGKGHAFIASNTGVLVFIDYSKTDRIGNLSDRTVVMPLIRHLDDVAPLSGPGSAPVAVVASPWKARGLLALLGAMLIILIAGATRLARLRGNWRRAQRDRLPRWDVRRTGQTRSPFGTSGS